jgi:hypothetical protein
MDSERLWDAAAVVSRYGPTALIRIPTGTPDADLDFIQPGATLAPGRRYRAKDPSGLVTRLGDRSVTASSTLGRSTVILLAISMIDDVHDTWQENRH